ncbi:serine hydrolase [Geminocystis sp. NIES-3709]|uniref:serine hydrolase n=1 Tax=Geminocystis sp. NIES-3709 TaxID=1617448 RepID=UPI0005FCBB97|nr:serine hydrolase [Geminocystis sp. NIES-3709]BAQ64847.1 hypothetical protein GM3709_1612 [Geminocystis sp. NIES-3709]
MKLSRRYFAQILGISGLATTFYPLATKAVNNSQDLQTKIINLFSSLPGQKAMEVLAIKNNTSWKVSLNPEMSLFCGSSFKVYVLTEFLRQMEAGKVTFTDKLSIDDNVRTLSSPVFEELSGKTTALIALEAMMMHSDNTATDMILHHINPEKVRQLIEEIGLKNTIIPDSTRIFFSYLLGADNNIDLGWQKISQEINNLKNPTRNIINNRQTMMSSPQDFVNFYAEALQGKFFQKSETLTEFKRILSLPNIINKFIPEGALGYVKGGSISFTPQYALSIAGGVRFSENHWAYYSFLINWDDSTDKLEPEIANSFLKSISQTMTLVMNH